MIFCSWLILLLRLANHHIQHYYRHFCYDFKLVIQYQTSFSEMDHLLSNGLDCSLLIISLCCFGIVIMPWELLHLVHFDFGIFYFSWNYSVNLEIRYRNYHTFNYFLEIIGFVTAVKYCFIIISFDWCRVDEVHLSLVLDCIIPAFKIRMAESLVKTLNSKDVISSTHLFTFTTSISLVVTTDFVTVRE